MGDTRWERRRYLSERPLLASRKISTERMKSLLHLSLAFSLGWTLKYIDWNLHLYWLLSAFSLGWTQKQVGCREMRRCPCALFQMANEDSTAFTETEQDGKNIQCQSSGNGISMNGFFLLPHEIASEPTKHLGSACPVWPFCQQKKEWSCSMCLLILYDYYQTANCFS